MDELPAPEALPVGWDGMPQDERRRGRGAKFRCLVRDQISEDTHIKAEGKAGRMGQQLMAVVAEWHRGRKYLEATEEHVAAAEKAQLRSGASVSVVAIFAYDIGGVRETASCGAEPTLDLAGADARIPVRRTGHVPTSSRAAVDGAVAGCTYLVSVVVDYTAGFALFVSQCCSPLLFLNCRPRLDAGRVSTSHPRP